MQAHTHKQTHFQYMHPHTYNTNLHTCTHIDTRTPMHTHTPIHTHTHTHTRAHTHTRVEWCALSQHTGDLTCNGSSHDSMWDSGEGERESVHVEHNLGVG